MLKSVIFRKVRNILILKKYLSDKNEKFPGYIIFLLAELTSIQYFITVVFKIYLLKFEIYLEYLKTSINMELGRALAINCLV